MKSTLEAYRPEAFARPLGEIARLVVDGDSAAPRIHVELGLPAAGVHESLAAEIRALVKDAAGATPEEVRITSDIVAHGVQRNLSPLEGVRNVIAVASGKGGVGKSTVAVNLALAIAADGGKVGLLDADIYGPSQPHMLGLVGERPVSEDGKSMRPLRAHGIDVMSIGFLIDPDQPMVWRGPMVTSALNQMLTQTLWQDLDYLIVDMPPGTGDIQLTLSQQVPVSGAVIVTTPQDIAAIDARKGLAMFRKVSIPVLGVIENMSTHICASCGHESAVFGTGGAEQMAADFDVELLGQLPLDAAIRETTDAGRPSVVAEPASAGAAAFVRAARRTTAALAGRGKDYSSVFPRIVVEDS
ncbi:MAG: iron-sulfur cluster carrier protein ApbC [Pseudomonadota bacterium]